MLHGTAPRAAHRAAPGGLALLVRQAPARQTAGSVAGQHRQPQARPRLPQVTLKEPQRTMHLVMTGIGALIMLGICGLSAFFVIVDERRGFGASDTGTAAVTATVPYAISSRHEDPAPLSLEEVFTSTQLELRSGTEPYRVSMTHIDTDCDTATTGSLGRLLESAGCSQVVRAEMTAPYGDYQVTAGLFNLDDSAASARVGRQTRSLVDSGGGGFAAMSAGAAPGEDPRARPGARMIWHDRGHFLIYCVVTRPDGAPVPADDPFASRIGTDLLDTYLTGEIIGRRARPS